MSTTNQLPLETVHRVRDHCLCLFTQRAARALARRFDEALKPAGLNNGQFSLLMALARPEPWAMGKLADFLAMDRTTLTAKLKPLERRGLISLKADEQDRRNRRIALTPAGRGALAAAMPIWEAEHAAVEKLISGDCDELRGDLAALSRAGP